MSLVGYNMEKSEKIKWLVTILIGIVIALIPASDFYTMEVRKFFTITAVIILIVAMELVDCMVAGIAMLFLYVLTGVAPMATVFGGFTGTGPWIVCGCLTLVACLEVSGLLKRISFWCLCKTGSSWKGIYWGLFLAGFLTAGITMANAYPVIGGLAVGIVASMGLKDTPASSALGMVACFSGIATRCIIYSPVLIAIQQSQSLATLGAGYPGLNLYNVFIYNWPMIFYVFIVCAIMCKMFKPDKELNGKDYFIEEYKALGKMTRPEKNCAIVLVIMIAWMLLDKWIPISSDYSLMLLPYVLFLPFLKVGDSDTLKKVNYSIILFVPCCAGIGNAANYLGVGQAIANMLVPFAQAMGSYMVLGVVYLLTVLLNFILTPYAIQSCMTIPFLEIGNMMGIDPLAINFMMMHGADCVLMPYEYTTYLTVYAFGIIRMSDFMKISGIKMVIMTAWLFVFLLPYYGLVGLY